MTPIVVLLAVLIVVGAIVTGVKGQGWWWALPRWVRFVAAGLVAGLVMLAAAMRAARAQDGGVCQAEPTQTFHLVGPIGPEVVPYVLEFLASTKNPRLVISSQGGSMQSSIEIYAAIKAHGNVTCHVRRWALSGAATILQACRQREIEPNAQLGLHEPRGMMPGPMERVAAEMWLRYLEDISGRWNEMSRFRMKLSAAEYEAKVKGRDWLLSAADAVKLGAADRIVP